jgi:ectoine hydroxylase-related dioxygenase (phytanoyl-CoA dioxygenase family)
MTTDEHVEQLRARGYTVVPNVLSRSEIDPMRQTLDAIFRREAKVASRWEWQNEVYKVAYMLPNKNALFRALCTKEPLLRLMRAALGQDCVVSSVNGFAMMPGGREQPLHIDQAESVPGSLLTINAIHVLDDFTQQNGCTRLVPGSQDHLWTGQAADIEAAERDAVHVEAPAGSVIAFSGGVWHAGSGNRTADLRRAVHAFFARPWIRPQWDFPRSLSADIVASLTPEERRLFGFTAPTSRYDARSDREVSGEPPHRGWIAEVASRLRRRHVESLKVR